MASDKLIQLFEALKQATNGGRVRWSETSSEGRFRVNLGGGDLEIERERPPVTLKSNYLDSDPREYTYVIYIQSPNSTKTSEVEFFDPKDDQEYRLVKDLYAGARKAALNLDQILDAMIANIGQSQ